MSWKDLKKIVGTAAPIIGTALGGSGGALVGSLMAKALGCEDNPTDVLRALKNDPQAMLKIRELEINERLEIQRLALETLRTELDDTQNARSEHRGHWMPPSITLVLSVMVVGMFWAIAFANIPENKNEIIYLILGQILNAFLTAVGYWIGTSRSSHNKTSLLGAK